MAYFAIFGFLEIIIGYFVAVPLLLELWPWLKSEYEKLPPVKRGLFKRKCVSIVHVGMICAGITYGHFAEESLAIWLFRIHSEIWVGFFIADTIVAESNGTASFDDRCHHAIYSILHGTITYVSGTNPTIGYMGFKFFKMRYYADFFNTNMQLRLILGLFKMKDTTFYTVNYHILAIGFFFVRVAVIPFAWISFYQNYSQVWKLVCSG